MKKRDSILFSFLVFFIFNLVGQNQREVDSLQLLLPKLGQDTLRIQTLNQLARYLIDINPEKSLNYAKEAFESTSR